MLPAKKPKFRSGIVRPGQPFRSRRHLRYVETFCCCVCGSVHGVKAAHLRIRTDGGEGLKPSDYWTTPLCFTCHITEQHQKGEVTFWRKAGKDPHKTCIEFARTSPVPEVREYARNMESL